MPKWSKQTYNMVADHLAAANAAALNSEGAHRAGAIFYLGKLAEAFAITFADDNERFAKARFIQATLRK